MLLSTAAGAGDSSLEARITSLEGRLAALEQRLATNEKATETAQIMAVSGGVGNSLSNNAALDIMANSAWRNLRWTRPVQWQGVVPGISEAEVIQFLGEPPRSVKSLKPRVDKVFYYETSLGDQNNALSGRISFRDGKVIEVRKPNFQAKETAQ
ncbi:MAG: ABC transporter C-terminal domain-containing protein [Opitutales bacterium]